MSLVPMEPGLSILDIGCGYGSHLAQARRRGWRCFGIETSKHAREIIAQRHGRSIFVVEDVEYLLPHEFDLVVLFDVLEHLPDPYHFFYALFAKGAITPKTRVIITTPNARSTTAVTDPSNWSYLHPPSHLVYFSGCSINLLLQQLRFRSIEIQGIYAESVGDKPLFEHENLAINNRLASFNGLLCKASGSDFSTFMQERYVPGTWSTLAEYEHLPRYLFAKDFCDGKQVLDFGCGTGYGTAVLAQQAHSVFGIDIDASALEWARQHHTATNLAFEEKADLGLSLPNQSFDVIICFEMIEHVYESTQVEAVQSFARLLKNDGLLIISTPNPEITKLYGPNPFHLKELSRDEFLGLLHKQFPYVLLLEQAIQPAILIQPSEDAARYIRSASLTRQDIPKSAIFIALCSHQPISIPESVCFLDFRNDFIAQQIHGMDILNRIRLEYYQATQEITNQAAEIHRLHDALAAKDQAVAQQAAEIHRLHDALAAKDQAVAQQAAEIHRLHDALAAKDQAVAQQAAEIHRLHDALAAKDQAVAQQAAEIHRLHDALAAKDQAVAQQAAEIHRLHDALAAKDQAVAQQAAEIHRLHDALAAKDQAVAQQAAEIHRLHDALAAKDQAVAQQAAEIHRLKESQNTYEAALAEKENLIDIQNEYIQRKESELAHIKNTNWHKLGVALHQERMSIIKFAKVIYYFSGCITPVKWKPAFHPLVSSIRKHFDALTSSTSNVTPQLISPPTDIKAKRRRVLHIIGNFMLGGSSRLIADLVERLSDRYEQQVITQFLPSPPAYEGIVVEEIRTPGTLEKISKVIQDYSPDLVHFHYWGDCDWWWYDIFFRAVEHQKCKVMKI